MGSLDLTEITRILQLDEAQTEVEINTCNTIDADLKNQTRTKLTESNEIKQRQALAVQNGEDVENCKISKCFQRKKVIKLRMSNG